MVPLWRLTLWFLRNVARNSPARISNIEITSLEFCGFLDTYEKLGYPNYVRLLIDEAPKANSCVRSSSHDTVHDPRDASKTTPTPQNAKSRFTYEHARGPAQAHQSANALTPTNSAKVQTHCAKTAYFRRYLLNGSAVWRTHRHQSGGITRHGGHTRRRHAARGLHIAQNPHCHTASKPRGRHTPPNWIGNNNLNRLLRSG